MRDPGSEKANLRVAKPHVVIPVFPGTNCEYDSKAYFERAGATAETVIIRNLSPEAVEDSIARLVKEIKNSQIVMLPGGFSGGDEPDGSGKFITAVFRNPLVKEAVMELLKKRDGLMLGICNGFQALVKLGLVPYGEIRPMREDSPTLTFNAIGRHASCLVRTKVASVKSPLAGKRKRRGCAHNRHLPWRGPVYLHAAGAASAHCKRADCHAVLRCGGEPRHGYRG